MRRYFCSRQTRGFSHSSFEFPESFRNATFELAFNQLRTFDPCANQITPFPAANKYEERYRLNKLKTHLNWAKPSQVYVHYTEAVERSSPAHHVFAGGLATLFYAVRTAQKIHEKGLKERVIFVNDGEYPTFKSSGLQLHTHGTQYTDYNVGYLMRKFVEENLPFLGLGKEWHDFQYDNLHLRLGKKFFRQPLENAFHYGRFFLNQLHHDLFSHQGVGPNDKKLVLAVCDSLRLYRQLNEQIVRAGLRPIAATTGRLRMSYNKDGIDKYERKWRNMGIPTTRLGDADLRRSTVLRVDSLSQPLHAFAMMGDEAKDILPDGHVKPHLMETIIEFALKSYPAEFEFLPARIMDVHICKETSKASRIDLVDLASGRNHSLPVQPDFVASLGHNAVFKENKTRPVYPEYTATGVTINFVLTIEVDQLVERRLGGQTTREGVKKFIDDGGLLPTADLCNLHVTIYDAAYESDPVKCVEVVKLFCRATEGANFNADGNVADKRDFLNVFRKIHEFYEGEFELVSAGSCTRHTWLENMPRQDGVFLNGQSGVGVSYAGFDFTKWQKGTNGRS